MAGTSRKNKAPRVKGRHEEENWFSQNRQRQRKRAKIARASRRANRRGK